MSAGPGLCGRLASAQGCQELEDALGLVSATSQFRSLVPALDPLFSVVPRHRGMMAGPSVIADYAPCVSELSVPGPCSSLRHQCRGGPGPHMGRACWRTRRGDGELVANLQHARAQDTQISLGCTAVV